MNRRRMKERSGFSIGRLQHILHHPASSMSLTRRNGPSVPPLARNSRAASTSRRRRQTPVTRPPGTHTVPVVRPPRSCSGSRPPAPRARRVRSGALRGGGGRRAHPAFLFPLVGSGCSHQRHLHSRPQVRPRPNRACASQQAPAAAPSQPTSRLALKGRGTSARHAPSAQAPPAAAPPARPPSPPAPSPQPAALSAAVAPLLLPAPFAPAVARLEAATTPRWCRRRTSVRRGIA